MSPTTDPLGADAPAEEGPDPTLKAAILRVAIVGLFFTAGAFGTFDVKTGLSVALGAATAVANLAALAKIMRGVLGGKSSLWGPLALAKVLLLLGGVWWLLMKGAADVLPFVVGFGALPVGIALTFGGRRPSEGVSKRP